MRGDNYLFAVTTQADPVTGDAKPLFAFPVQVCKASEDKRPSFDIAAPSGAERKQQFIDSATGEVIEDADCMRGVRVGDEFKVVAQEQIEKINAEEKITTIVVEGALDLIEARARYADRVIGRYFLQSPAKGGSPKAYRLTYEALARDGRALVIKRTKRTNQSLSLVYADTDTGCLMLLDVLFPAQIRQPDELIKQPVATAEVQEKQIKTLQMVLDNMPDGNDAITEAIDTNAERKRELIEAAINGEPIKVPEPISTTVENDDLMAALEASLA